MAISCSFRNSQILFALQVAASSWSSLFTLPAPASTFVVFGHPHEMLISLPGTGAERLLWGRTWFTRPYQANLVGG